VLADQLRVPASTLKGLFRSLGIPVRPRGRVPHLPQPELAQPQPQPVVVEVAQDVITVRAWAARSSPRSSKLAAGRVVYAPRGRSGLPERPSIAEWTAAGIAFRLALLNGEGCGIGSGGHLRGRAMNSSSDCRIQSESSP
jgi:hypothetical protein